MILKNIGVIAILIALVSCKAEKKEQPQQENTRLTTNLEEVKLRAAPGETANVLKTLAKGAVLYDLGEVSDFTTPVQLRGIQFDEPWLKVRAEDGTIGWVYGGVLNFEMRDADKVANLLMEKRLQTLFGKQIADRIKTYRIDFQNVKSENELARAYRNGTKLRDTLVRLMGDRILVSDPNKLPDLFWLKEAMPGFTPQLVAEGTAYYLFWDYKVLINKANVTPETSDNDFVQLAITLFPEDSVEYFYPAWFLQTWDYGGSSLLGRGTHLAILKKMDEALQKSAEFTPEITEWKQLLINDITNLDVNYWETLEKITTELSGILASNFKILTDADKIALETRLEQFAAPTEHNIQVNQQAGN